MRRWVDPPQGYLYGFPKVWDDTVESMAELLDRHNVPEDAREWVRMWPAEQDEQQDNAT